MPPRSELAAVVLLSTVMLLAACGKKDEEKPEDAEPPPPGGASSDVVATNIGTGLGLPADMAPTSATWDQVFALGDKIAVIAGRAHDESIALRTIDSGRSWTPLHTAADAYARWNAARDGALVLVSGPRKKVAAPPGKLAPVESARVWFAPVDGALSQPATFFPRDGTMAGTTIADGHAIPALLTSQLASLVVDRGPAPLIAFTAPVGQTAAEPAALPRGRWLSTPYGRPAQLLSIGAGGAVEVRPWPSPGESVAGGSPIPGLRAIGTLADQLDQGPDCECGVWSFARVTTVPGQSQLIGISAERAFAFAAPAGSGENLGCGVDGLVVDNEDEKKQPKLVRCAFDGKCAEPKSPPFELWPEPHEKRMHLVATKKGVVATLSARAGTRWGVYLAQSLDGGATFQLPRVVGEGKTDRGRFEVGALVGLETRVLMLLSADELGTGRRRWYILASDDDGSNWGPP